MYCFARLVLSYTDRQWPSVRMMKRCFLGMDLLLAKRLSATACMSSKRGGPAFYTIQCQLSCGAHEGGRCCAAYTLTAFMFDHKTFLLRLVRLIINLPVSGDFFEAASASCKVALAFRRDILEIGHMKEEDAWLGQSVRCTWYSRGCSRFNCNIVCAEYNLVFNQVEEAEPV
jgi:hypothetical protein